MEFPSFDIENSLLSDYPLIAGLDEAGRGPLAGPVVAAAVILPKNGLGDFGINDSKKLTDKKRELLFDIITKNAVAYGVGMVDSHEIDRINILNATMKAFELAINNMKIKPDFLLVDGNCYRNEGILYKTIVKGDAKSLSIAAASILAKVTRDRWMTEIADKKYPEYDFSKHKGYPTKKHFDLIKKNGISDIHRTSFLIKFAYRENINFGNNFENNF